MTVTPQDQAAQDQAGQTFGLLVLTRVLLRRFVIAYVPFGPTVDPGAAEGRSLPRWREALRPHLPQGTLFLRYDLPWDKAGEEPAWRGRGGLTAEKSPSDIQPPNTVVVDISGRLMTFWRP